MSSTTNYEVYKPCDKKLSKENQLQFWLEKKMNIGILFIRNVLLSYD